MEVAVHKNYCHKTKYCLMECKSKGLLRLNRVINSVFRKWNWMLLGSRHVRCCCFSCVRFAVVVLGLFSGQGQLILLFVWRILLCLLSLFCSISAEVSLLMFSFRWCNVDLELFLEVIVCVSTLVSHSTSVPVLFWEFLGQVRQHFNLL